MPCYKPPGPPTNLTLLFVDHISAILSWNVPIREHVAIDTNNQNSKYSSDIVYKVVCSSCSSNVVFTPSADTFNDTKLTLTNLEPVTTYTIQIHSMNGVSYIIENATADEKNHKNSNESFGNQDKEENSKSVEDNIIGNNVKVTTVNNNQPIDLSQLTTEWAEIVFTTTESAIQSTVSNVRVVSTTSTVIDLIWDKPVQNDVPIEFYEVRWFPKPDFDTINKTALNTKETKAHIENLNENTEYGFQIRYKTLNGYGTYSNIVYAHTQAGVSSGNVSLIFQLETVLKIIFSVYEDNIQMRIVAGATVAVVVILVLVIVATVLFLRSKNQDDIDKKSSNHMPLPLDYASNEGN